MRTLCVFEGTCACLYLLATYLALEIADVILKARLCLGKKFAEQPQHA